jgi:flagellar biosynthetic protein FliQ
MSVDFATQLFVQLLWTTVLVTAPVMAVALLVGLAVSVLQVATQIQEMSLSFVPKLLAVAAVLALLGPWMLKRISAYASGLISAIPGQF